MESQQAADDIIERLHGSNVLGWSEKLEVHHLGSHNKHVSCLKSFKVLQTHGMIQATNIPDLAIHGVNLSQINALQSPMQQPIFDVAPSHNLPIPTPSIGVYQHQDLQLNDLSRLLESMKFSFDTQSKQMTEIPVLQHELGHSHVSQPSEISSFTKQTQTPRTRSLFELAQLQALASMSAISRQASGKNNAGLGINVSSLNTNSSEPAVGALSFHQYREVQDPTSGQQAQFQTTYGSSAEALQVLQAAVNVQDRALSGSAANTIAGSPLVGWRADERGACEMTFSALSERVVGQVTDNNQSHLLGRMYGLDGSSGNGSSHSRMAPTASRHGFHRAGMRIPPPILPGTAMSGINTAFNGTSVTNVPHLLPALSPSSPHASSEEPSPITPTFQQLPRTSSNNHEKDS